MSLISQHSRRLMTTRDSSRWSAIRMWSKSWAIPFRNSFTFVLLSKSSGFNPSVNAFIFLSVWIVCESFFCKYSSRCRSRCAAGSSSWILKILGIWNRCQMFGRKISHMIWPKKINLNSQIRFHWLWFKNKYWNFLLGFYSRNFLGKMSSDVISFSFLIRDMSIIVHLVN